MDALLVRPIRAADLPQLRAFMRALSPQTRYLRFLSPRTPSEEEIAHWAAADASHEYALVATEGDRLVGEARFVVESPDEADVAIVVADGWQGRGLGRELMTRLVAAARSRGLRRLTGIALSTNSAVLALARRLGFRLSRTPGAGWVTTLTLELKA